VGGITVTWVGSALEHPSRNEASADTAPRAEIMLKKSLLLNFELASGFATINFLPDIQVQSTIRFGNDIRGIIQHELKR
jgi:hypothetical protein